MDLFAQIATIDDDHISDVVSAVMQRYRELFPAWDICLFTFEINGNRNEQLDAQIAFLQQLKDSPCEKELSHE